MSIPIKRIQICHLFAGLTVVFSSSAVGQDVGSNPAQLPAPSVAVPVEDVALDQVIELVPVEATDLSMTDIVPAPVLDNASDYNAARIEHQVAPVLEMSSPLSQPAPTIIASEPLCELGCRQESDLNALAIDIARRVVLAHYKHAGRNSINTRDVRVRRQGDQVHTYARVAWSPDKNRANVYHSDVFSSIVMARGVRRVYRIGYKDNFRVPMTNCDETSPIITQINDDFQNRDPLGLPSEKLSDRGDVLFPRSNNWLKSIFSGDRDWHVGIAKDRHCGSNLK